MLLLTRPPDKTSFDASSRAALAHGPGDEAARELVLEKKLSRALEQLLVVYRFPAGVP